MELSSHAKRVVTGLVLLALVVCGLYFQGVVLFGLIAILGGLALLEFYAMFWPSGTHFLDKLVGLPLVWAIFWAAQHSHLQWCLGLLILAFAYTAIRFLVVFGNGNESVFSDWAVMPAGLLYIGCFLSPALALQPIEQILVILAPVVSDIGGYYVGMKFGKKKIWPRVSPKKSWMGSIGGLCACIILCLVMGLTWGRQFPGAIFAFLLLGVALNAASQMGDFFESALKRTQGVKDSGTILPGHGGVLDRIDSLLFAVPMYVLLNLAFQFFG